MTGRKRKRRKWTLKKKDDFVMLFLGFDVCIAEKTGGRGKGGMSHP